MTRAVALADIRIARDRIAGKVERTPTVLSHSLSEQFGVPVHLKLEHRQTTGSFKLRGASNAVASLNAEQKARGVVAASTGNHGRALAHAAKLEGMRAVICMSRLVPGNKLDEIRRLGAEVRIVGDSQDDAQQEVDRLVAQEGLVMLPPFDHPDIIAGQGTVGLEMIDQVPDAALVLVQLSGGGLASGVATAIKGVSPRTKVIGVSMARGAAMKASLDAGQPVLVEELPTLADSLGGGIGLDNRLTFAMCRDLLDDVILLSEEEIAAGIRHAYAREREIVEGAGAVGIAALLAGKVRSDGPVVVLLSGRNIDMDAHRTIVCGVAPSLKERAA
ncbi:hydroxyectoine utilization dehydratase EutB [Mesorhizobium sp. M7A.T.Ca.TU.009.01.3.2]|uniref:hydroxyectoine utilization dehydratase EutB n=1 Tax=Mesorhizobium sp. M7A.F.Ca.MR.245.00.0.0 TaxID=2496778 RepID=UPI000FC9B868|nr:hydroxyectoine utilization dehydratase EutB [Mesorhizobium sp. M7A.F.Ca.MR.245.00.0.0]RUU07492.1 hydroxyectoine utilization dehydratase EutB [Mesorhizobium sp. M7A.T.Ca.TU.009.01.3.2]RUV11212.1 hydroxyectoine utilization dehydratase EutB [Mesorhizobium sp. M7A.T.Ca.TU.009.01.3.1]RUV52249.1 hydroxyectoine utilization dehydratase EutB [Mesorhizobium sp. M7A.F.Ca.MR.228.00.0.0]RWO39358.1 MAG: hydroxyectoine utilization dehydratase EutB [Mesorhizobium sp.]RUV18293.1 hydroxyectoine utilization d